MMSEVLDLSGTHHRGTLPIVEVTAMAERIAAAVGSVILGKSEVIRLALVALLTEGHLLIEDVPGTGKTNLAKALARCISGQVSRVQFTPDLMPSDVTGVSIYQRASGEFTFRHGPIFTNVLIADEVNRASPKTQSALLEAMEERQVTVDGDSFPLPRPFLVLATQNPVDMEGTYPLPEAQRDRFLARTAIGYPDPGSELAMLQGRQGLDPLAELQPITDVPTVSAMIRAVEGVRLSRAVGEYVVAVVGATRTARGVRLGASPRAVLHLGRAAKAAAVLAGRDFVIPDDVVQLARPVLGHRIITTIEAQSAGMTAEMIIAEVMSLIPVPLGGDGMR